MSIALDQLDKIVHSLNEDIGGAEKGYLAELYSTGYTYGISLNGFALYDPDLHALAEDVDEDYQIERISRENLLEYCNFWEQARIRVYVNKADQGAPRVDYK